MQRIMGTWSRPRFGGTVALCVGETGSSMGFQGVVSRLLWGVREWSLSFAFFSICFAFEFEAMALTLWGG